mgnify:CR=1 FL=1
MSMKHEFLSNEKVHSDLSDLSTFDVNFEQNSIFTKNKYTDEFEEVKDRKGIFLDIPEENTYQFVAPVTSKYKLIKHTDLFSKLNKAILKNNELSKENIEITDRAYDDYTKAHRSILFKDHSQNLGDTGIGQDDISCLRIDLLNSTNTTWKLQAFVGQYRDFCQNTMVFGGERYFHIAKKHTSGFNVAEETAKIGRATGDFAEHGEIFRKMLKTPVTEEWVIKLFKHTVCKKDAVELAKVNYQNNKETANALNTALENEFTAEELEKKTVNFKLLGALLARLEDELENGMGMNLYTVYNALTNWSSHVGTEQDSYESKETGAIIHNTNKGSKLHNVQLDRQRKVIEIVNSNIWQRRFEYGRLVA